MQGLEKCHERSGLRRTQVLSVRWHVTAALNHLADELILREPHGDAVQHRASLPADSSKGVAVAALLNLQNQRALALKRGCTVQKFFRNRITTPGVHVRTPRCESSEVGKGPERDRDQQH